MGFKAASPGQHNALPFARRRAGRWACTRNVRFLPRHRTSPTGSLLSLPSYKLASGRALHSQFLLVDDDYRHDTYYYYYNTHT